MHTAAIDYNNIPGRMPYLDSCVDRRPTTISVRAKRLQEGLFDGSEICRESFAKYMADNGLLGQGMDEITPATTVGQMIDACLKCWICRLEAAAWAQGEAEHQQLLADEARAA